MVQFDTSGCTSPKETGLERSSREPYSSHGVAGAVDEGKVFCQRFGMTDRAWDGWCKMHVNPTVGISWFFLAETGNLLCFLNILSALRFDLSMHFYAVTLPLAAALTCDACQSVLMWRLGPQIVLHPLCMVLTATYVLGSCPMLITGYVLSESHVPWNNRVHFICVHGVGAWFALQAAAAGKLAGEHPLQPRATIIKPLIPITMRSLQFMDSLTDMTLIRTFIQAKGESCWWYGQAGRCRPWTVLIVVLSVCAATDVGAVLGVVIIGKEATTKSKGIKRMSKALELLCLMCELGAVVCTLLYLFNLKLSTIAGYNDMDADETQKQISFTFLSVAITITIATVKAVGVSKVVRAVHSATHDEEVEDQNTDSEERILTSVTDMPNTLDQGQDGDVMQSSVMRPSVAGLRPGGASDS